MFSLELRTSFRNPAPAISSYNRFPFLVVHASEKPSRFLRRFYMAVACIQQNTGNNEQSSLRQFILERVASSPGVNYLDSQPRVSVHERVAAMGSNEGCGIVGEEELEDAVQFHKKQRGSAAPAAPQNTASSPPDDPRGTANFLSRVFFW